MESKNGKKISIFFICIVVILLGVIGYLFFDKYKNDNSNSDTNKISVVDDVASLLTNDDLKSSFNNLVKNSNGVKISYTCNTFDSNKCLSAKILIDDKINSSVDLNTCGLTKIIKSAKYFVVEKNTGCGADLLTFTIYNLNGSSIYNESNGTIYKNKTYVENNIYYYNTFTTLNNNNTLYYKSIDLSKDTIIVNDIKNESVTDMPGAIS